MDINAQTLDALTTGFRHNFEGAFAGVEPQWRQVATEVPSTTEKESYPWLGDVPGMREWLGPRVVHQVGEHDYTVKNRSWEQTLGVPRTKIQDDTFGIYSPLFANMGDAAARHPDELVFDLIRNGFTEECYDGQPMFDTEHPVGLAEDGGVELVSNMADGGQAPWFLLDLSRPLRPFIFQNRKAPEFVAKDDLRDDNVFWRGEYVYGADARNNVGYGFWQMAFGSMQALDKTTFRAARAAMRKFRGDRGRPLGVKPTHILVGSSQEGAARDLFLADRDANGASNTERNAVQIIISDYLE